MRLTFFRTFIVPVTVLSVVLVGCSSSPAESSDSPDSPSSAPSGPTATAPIDLAGMTNLSIEAEFEQVQSPSGLLAPGVDLQVTEVATLGSVSPAVYEDITGKEPVADEPIDPESDEKIESVTAADGHQFFVAKFSSTDPQWEPRGEIPRTEGFLVVGGSELDRVLNTDDSTRYQGTIIVSLPQDAQAKDAVLEIETQDKRQSISLVDGQRIDSQVPHVYESAQVTAEVTSADEIDEGFIGWAKQDDRVAGKVVGAYTAPWLGRANRGSGWASPDKMYLSVEAEWRRVSATTFDKTSMYIELPDGDIIHPENDINLGTTLKENAVFLVPVDATEVVAVIEPKVVVGAGNSAPVLEWDNLESTIVLTKAAQ